MSRKYQLKLLLIVTTPNNFCLIYKIKSVLRFSGLLLAKDTLFDRYLAQKIRLLRYWHLNVSATSIKNVLIADFAQKKKVTILFPLSFIDISTCNTIK